jgi:hypothetical protein
MLLLCTFAPFFSEVNTPMHECFAVATGRVAAVRVYVVSLIRQLLCGDLCIRERKRFMELLRDDTRCPYKGLSLFANGQTIQLSEIVVTEFPVVNIAGQ